MNYELMALIVAAATPVLGFIAWLLRLESNVKKNTRDIELHKEEVKKELGVIKQQRQEDREERHEYHERQDKKLDIIQEDIKTLIKANAKKENW